MEGNEPSPRTVAGRTPRRLETCASERLVLLLLQSVIPAPLPPLLLDSGDWSTSNLPTDDEDTLDKIILSQENIAKPQLLQKKRLLINRLHCLKTWYDECDWLGVQGSPTRRLLRHTFSQVLDRLDKHCLNPMMKLVLHLCFGMSAGDLGKIGTPVYGQMLMQMYAAECRTFKDLLDSLAPFGIEELSTKSYIFADYDVLKSIFKNTPLLKKIHMRHNISDEAVFYIGTNCHNLECFVIEPLFGKYTVPEDVLYETFFCDLNKQMIMERLTQNSDVSLIPLSFPNLKCVDIGLPFQTLSFHLQLCYKELRSLTCNSKNIRLNSLNPPKVPIELSTLNQNLVDLELSVDCINNCDLVDPSILYPGIKHITILLADNDASQNFFNLGQKTKEIITKFKIESLKITLASETVSDSDLLQLMVPSLRSIGSCLHVLQVWTMREMEVESLCQLLQHCPQLHSLGIQTDNESEALLEGDKSNIKIPKFQHLQSLSIACVSSYLSAQKEELLFSFINSLISNAPKLTTLDLELTSVASYWLMEVAVSGLLTKVQICRLSLVEHAWMPELNIDFYVPLIEVLQALKTVFFGWVRKQVFFELLNVYNATALNLSVSKKSIVCYEGIYSK